MASFSLVLSQKRPLSWIISGIIPRKEAFVDSQTIEFPKNVLRYLSQLKNDGSSRSAPPEKREAPGAFVFVLRFPDGEGHLTVFFGI